MSDAEAWQLIFAPGFSTAAQVTDVSGRGVGMDVVKKNIQALGGSVELASRDGAGTSVTIRLPLTLAILDGMSVAVGDDIRSEEGRGGKAGFSTVRSRWAPD